MANSAFTQPDTSIFVPKSLYDANTVLAATTDDTPAAVTMGASTILARLAAGNIKAATPTEIRTLLGVAQMAVLFDSTLGADTASIDTGAAGIDGGYNVLEIWIIARTDDASAAGLVDVIVNNDTSSIYDMQYVYGVISSAGAGNPLAQAKWALDAHGSGGSSGYAGVFVITIPCYAQTTFWKAGTLVESRLDATAGSQITLVSGLGYRATTAISRMKIAAEGAAKLKAGSRLLIYGR